MRTPPMRKKPSSPNTPKPLIPILRIITTSQELRTKKKRLYIYIYIYIYILFVAKMFLKSLCGKHKDCKYIREQNLICDV